MLQAHYTTKQKEKNHSVPKDISIVMKTHIGIRVVGIVESVTGKAKELDA